MSPGLDADGWILPEADLANVPAAYAGVPEAAGTAMAAEFGPALHSGYLYGSVARGNAVPGRSDLDLLAVLHEPPGEADAAAAARIEATLLAQFPSLTGAKPGLTHVAEVFAPAERYGLVLFLRDFAVCLTGTDLRPGLPRSRPSAEVAAGLHGDTPEVIERGGRTLRDPGAGPEARRRAARIVARRLVQAAFAVVMASDHVWATVLEEQAALAGAAVPEWADDARLAAAQGRDPDPEVVAGLLDGFGARVLAELRRVVASANTGVDR
jgi:hypothetical protein